MERYRFGVRLGGLSSSSSQLSFVEATSAPTFSRTLYCSSWYFSRTLIQAACSCAFPVSCLCCVLSCFSRVWLCVPPGSSVHQILQARILERVAMPFSRESSKPRDQTRVSCVSCIAGEFFAAETRREAHFLLTFQQRKWSATPCSFTYQLSTSCCCFHRLSCFLCLCGCVLLFCYHFSEDTKVIYQFNSLCLIKQFVVF